ncbi:MAG TPA: hypothetical protein VM532_04855 [Burkholderiales bacterium]|nr:hypothetical protein [Burkholderiales bacterium]
MTKFKRTSVLAVRMTMLGLIGITGLPFSTFAQSDVAAQGEQKVNRLAADLAAELAKHCPVVQPNDESAYNACRRGLFEDSQTRRALPPYVLWGRQKDPNATLKNTKLTQFAPDVWTSMYLPLFMFNGKHTVEYVEKERLFLVRLETAFRNRLAPGQFPYPFWHEADKWNFYENANSLLLWIDPQAATIKVSQFTAKGSTPPLLKVDPVAHEKFDGKWMWTDAAGKSQPQVTLFDGLFSANNPYKAKLDVAYKDLALRMREGQCETCHVPNNPDGMKKLVLLQTPAHAAGEIKRLLKSVRENSMPLDDLGIEKPLDESVKKALLESGTAFEAVVDAAKAWESKNKKAPIAAK